MALSNLDLPPAPVQNPAETLSPGRGPRFPKDAFLRRLGWACLISALVNLFLWWHAAGFVRRRLAIPPQPIEIQRIILPRTVSPKPKPPKKIVKPKLTIKPKPKPIVKPKPKLVIKPRPVVRPKPIVRPRPVVRPKPAAPPPAHHHILTAKGPAPATHTTLPGGHAQLGKPIAHQNAGEGNDNNQQPVKQPVMQPVKQPVMPPVQEPVKEPVKQPVPEPVQQPVKAPMKAVPAGPTQGAAFDPGQSPEIPDELKTDSFKSFVRVRVVVNADGSFTPILRTSSGNVQIDRLVLDALKRYGKAKPALQNGVPVGSVFLFKYEFDVQ